MPAAHVARSVLANPEQHLAPAQPRQGGEGKRERVRAEQPYGVVVERLPEAAQGAHHPDRGGQRPGEAP